MTLIKADEQRRFTSDLTHSHWSWLICGIFTIESVLFYWQYKMNQESDDRNGFNAFLFGCEYEIVNTDI